MKIHCNLSTPLCLRNTVATIGSFDGVHKGHQQVLSRLKVCAEEIDGESLVITFWPHPRLVLEGLSCPLKLLHTFNEKMDMLAEHGVHHVLKISFTKAISEMSSKKFIKDILVDHVHIKKLVVGYDHRFGKDRKGDITQLRQEGTQHGFCVEEIPPSDIDRISIGSSRIRKELVNGSIEKAEQLLGYPYSFSGRVVKGSKLGRDMGFPTANLKLTSPYKIVPSEGIYVVSVQHKKNLYGGMLYIGRRPTINGISQSIEVNIFDFSMSIYNDFITVKLVRSIRKDIKFNDIKELEIQLFKDKQYSLSILKEKNLL